jgi:hypothetical protein
MDTRFGIDCENFNLYFEKLIPSLSQPAKESLPKDVLFKMRKHRLGFFAKLFFLWKCFNKRIWIVVEDEDTGLSIDQFLLLKKNLKAKEKGVPKAEGFISTATFITASKELGDTFDYFNGICVSPAYHFLQRAKNQPVNKVAEYHDQLTEICRFLTHYESNRKKITTDTKLQMAEWLVLIYLYHGNEMLCSPIYKSVYRYSYNSSQTKIKLAFSTLQIRKYIEKIGIKKGTKFKITPLGRSTVNDIMSRFVLNW